MPPRKDQLQAAHPWVMRPERWLSLPTSYRHYHPAQAIEPGPACYRGRVLDLLPQTPAAPHRVRAQALIVGETVTVDCYGRVPYFRKCLAPTRTFTCWGTLVRQGRQWQLTNPDWVAARQLGEIEPIYGLAGAVNAPHLGRLMWATPLSDDLPRVAAHLAGQLTPAVRALFEGWLGNAPEAKLGQLLSQAHEPTDIASAQRACKLINALHHAIRAQQILADHDALPAPRRRIVITDAQIEAQLGGLPFTLTDEQSVALMRCVEGLAKNKPLRALINGPTGSGKTAIFGTLANLAVTAGARAVILAPSELLATQIHAQVRQWTLPEGIEPLLVTGGIEVSGFMLDPLLIGTTALLHRILNRDLLPDLVVVDEQNRFGVEQREALVAEASHLVEVTATAIPRSQALAEMGVLDVAEIHGTHVTQDLETRVLPMTTWWESIDEFMQDKADGEHLIVVTPHKEAALNGLDENEDASAALPDCESIARELRAQYPGRVAFAHGGRSEHQNAEALQTMVTNRADILVGTTVLECGIDLPRVRRVVILRADCFGLTTLHQIRGRLARTGGRGQCDLRVAQTMTPKAGVRMEAMLRTTDGFEIAREDLRIRGQGDLRRVGRHQSGTRQSAYGVPIENERIAKAVAILRARRN